MGRSEPAEDGLGDVSAVECRAQLGRILDSTEFDTTDRGRRFLRHVVEETLAGRGERIKAYSIAVEVFGRDASFDAQSDPIVRIEAGHLRRALERYYLTRGASDQVVITIPKGGYVPAFWRRPPQEARFVEPQNPQPPPQEDKTAGLAGRRSQFVLIALLVALLAAGSMAWWRTASGNNPAAPERPRLLVLPFEDLTGTEASAAIAKGLTQEIVGQLSKFKDIAVVEAVETQSASSVPAPRFTLGGTVNLSTTEFWLRVKVTSRIDGSVLWANSYHGELKVSEVVRAQASIASDVATTLAQSYGVIFNADASRNLNQPPDDWTAYSCTLSFYAYRAEVDLTMLPAVRKCLEEAVARFPNYATGWGLLSQAYIDTVRFTYPTDPKATTKMVELALAAARRAIDLDPLNVRGLQAEMFALYFTKDIEASLEAGKRALAINPNDTEVMGEYGYRLAQSGNWTDGCALVGEARARNPGPGAYYQAALALCAYFAGNYEAAATWIRLAAAENNPNYHAIAAAIYAEAGYSDEADRERAWLEANVPAMTQNLPREIARRFARPQDVDMFLRSLKKAGLHVGDGQR